MDSVRERLGLPSSSSSSSQRPSSSAALGHELVPAPLAVDGTEDGSTMDVECDEAVEAVQVGSGGDAAAEAALASGSLGGCRLDDAGSVVQSAAGRSQASGFDTRSPRPDKKQWTPQERMQHHMGKLSIPSILSGNPSKTPLRWAKVECAALKEEGHMDEHRRLLEFTEMAEKAVELVDKKAKDLKRADYDSKLAALEAFGVEWPADFQIALFNRTCDLIGFPMEPAKLEEFMCAVLPWSLDDGDADEHDDLGGSASRPDASFNAVRPRLATMAGSIHEKASRLKARLNSWLIHGIEAGGGESQNFLQALQFMMSFLEDNMNPDDVDAYDTIIDNFLCACRALLQVIAPVDLQYVADIDIVFRRGKKRKGAQGIAEDPFHSIVAAVMSDSYFKDAYSTFCKTRASMQEHLPRMDAIVKHVSAVALDAWPEAAAECTARLRALQTDLPEASVKPFREKVTNIFVKKTGCVIDHLRDGIEGVSNQKAYGAVAKADFVGFRPMFFEHEKKLASFMSHLSSSSAGGSLEAVFDQCLNIESGKIETEILDALPKLVLDFVSLFDSDDDGVYKYNVKACNVLKQCCKRAATLDTIREASSMCEVFRAVLKLTSDGFPDVLEQVRVFELWGALCDAMEKWTCLATTTNERVGADADGSAIRRLLQCIADAEKLPSTDGVHLKQLQATMLKAINIKKEVSALAISEVYGKQDAAVEGLAMFAFGKHDGGSWLLEGQSLETMSLDEVMAQRVGTLDSLPEAGMSAAIQSLETVMKLASSAHEMFGVEGDSGKDGRAAEILNQALATKRVSMITAVLCDIGDNVPSQKQKRHIKALRALVEGTPSERLVPATVWAKVLALAPRKGK